MSIDYRKRVVLRDEPIVVHRAPVARKPLAQPAEIADEAYGLGCATGDRYFAGVEALARYLATGEAESPELRAVLASIRYRACA